jgi:hypothetical protein
MAGVNTTGKPNTSDYNLGRGRVYFSTTSTDGSVVSTDIGRPVLYRDLGNCPEFNISVDVETLEHQSSQEGLKVTDKEFVISQKVNLSLSIDEINFQNVALFFSGDSTKDGFANGAAGGIADNGTPADGVELLRAGEAVAGTWVDIIDPDPLNSTYLERAYDIDAGGGVAAGQIFKVHQTAAGMETATDQLERLLADGSNSATADYELDAKMGRIFLIAGSSITFANAVYIWLDDLGTAGATVDEVSALSQSAVAGSLKFISENPADSDKQTEFEFHQVSLKADGDFGLISDEYTTLSLTGVAERNTELSSLGTSKTLTIRTHVNA